ncbi:MAG: alpha-D-ribose 1-methylphosphonate 5-triphosphate diphosphatase [Pseudomonadota bacterium]
MTRSLRLANATVLTPEGALERGDVHVADGAIVDAFGAADVIDCAGLTVLPGVVDVHGDAFEGALHPRPGVAIPFEVAMRSVDAQLIANGITTAFHGLTLSWEPGARSLDAGRRFMSGLAALRPALAADHRVQLRWETFAHEALEDIVGWLGGVPTPTLALNDHTTMTRDIIRSGRHAKLQKYAIRCRVTLDEYIALNEAALERESDVPAKIAEVAEMARAAGATMLSHDDRTAEERRAGRALGVGIAEFPLTREAATEARGAGEHTVLGGPNALRGGSHMGALSAEEAVREGLCTILASDYYYPSQFAAVERLVKRGVVDFPAGWSLISAAPAEAMGLTDRGAIAPGRRADLVVVERGDPWRIRHVATGGVVSSFA